MKRRKTYGKHSSNVRKSRARRANQNGKLNKKKVAIVVGIIFIIFSLIINKNKNKKAVETTANETKNVVVEEKPTVNTDNVDNTDSTQKPEKEITDWKLRLANYENLLPEDFKVEVKNIDKTRQFDARAINDLNNMMNAMKKDGITNIWVQSAYRSVARQKELYDASVKKYLQQGKTQEEAEELTNEYINKPGSSDHNLGLAVDFNKVDNGFEKLDGFKWLQKNAENYGFVLRYPKDKEDITKIAYESWHWRYVGTEHAKKMNELNMCLEEYIQYLKTH